MRIAIIGAFIFCMTVATIFYCVSEHMKIGVFATPFLLSILLVPYGLDGLGDK